MKMRATSSALSRRLKTAETLSIDIVREQRLHELGNLVKLQSEKIHQLQSGNRQLVIEIEISKDSTLQIEKSLTESMQLVDIMETKVTTK